MAFLSLKKKGKGGRGWGNVDLGKYIGKTVVNMCILKDHKQINETFALQCEILFSVCDLKLIRWEQKWCIALAAKFTLMPIDKQFHFLKWKLELNAYFS